MVTETGFNHAKEGWLAAAKTARGAKEHCQRKYEEDKELGLIGDEPFEKWAEMNAPGFMKAYRQFKLHERKYRKVAQKYDRERAKAWEKEYKRRWNDLHSRPGEENGSNFIIIIPDEEEQSNHIDQG